MCYNIKNSVFYLSIIMNCKVTICGADGESVTSSGDLQYCKYGFDIAYKISEDNCILSVRGGTITQSRKGSVNTDITFSKGKSTTCMLFSDGLTGNIPVKTLDLYAAKTENGAVVKITYFLDGTKISLNLSAVCV